LLLHLFFIFSSIFSFLLCHHDARDLHSFPTRRSSDLAEGSKRMNESASTIDLRNSFRQRHQLVSVGDELVAGMFKNDFLSVIFRSEEHTSELQSRFDLVCRLLLEKKNSGSSTHVTLFY